MIAYFLGCIGRGGQNVRLAAKLTGFKINIKGSEGQALSVTGEEEYEIDQLDLSDKVRTALIEAKITNMIGLEKSLDIIGDIEGIGPKAVKDITKQYDQFKELSTRRDIPTDDSDSIEAQEDKSDEDADADTEDQKSEDKESSK